MLRSTWIASVALLVGLVFLGCQQSSSHLSRGPASPSSSGQSAAANQPAVPPPVPAPATPTSVIRSQNAEPGGRRTDDVPALPVLPPDLDSARSEAPVLTGEQKPASREDELHRLHRVVSEQAATLDTYIARFRRREFFKGKEQPEEVISFHFRRQPYSVHMKWLSPEATAGREALYVKDHYENKLHVVVEKSMFGMGGKTMSFELDSPMVKEKSRHTITDAGIHRFVARFDAVLTALDRGDKRFGTLAYHGPQTRPEFARPAEMVEHVVPPGNDPLLPQGGRRFTYFDPDLQLPTLLITQDETGREVEYYLYDRVQRNVRLDDGDFSPTSLGVARK